MIAGLTRAFRGGGQRRRTVIVLGMHRSGTSVTAGIVRSLGVHLGDDLLGANRGNPMGHHEDLEVLELNDQILASSGGNWSDPPTREAILRNRRQFRPAIRKLVRARNACHRVWGWKDPRTALTLELFLPHLARPHLLVVRRDPEEVALSLSRRDGTDVEKNLALYEAYTARISKLLRDHPLPSLTVEFADLRAEAKREVARIARFLDVDASPETLEACAGLVLDDRALESARSGFEEEPDA